MNIDYLREYVTIAQTSSYTKTAKLLFTSVPTLSRHMQMLEKDMDCQLLQRDPHNVVLTNKGILLLERAKKILGDIDETYALLNKDYTKNMPGLTITIHEVDAYYKLFEQVRSFNASFPYLDAQIKSSQDHSFAGSLLNNITDIAIEMYNPANFQDGIRSMVIDEVDILLGVPAECHPKINSRVLDGKSLLIPSLSTSPGTSSYLDLVRKAGKIKNANITEVGSIVEMFDGIKENQWALLPRHYIRLLSENIAVYKLPFLPPVPIVALWSSNNRNPNIAKFIVHVNECLTKERAAN